MGAAQIIAAVADIELPRNEWPDLMSILMKNAQMENVNMKKAALSTIGFICESIVRFCPFLRS
jgi:importin subunit beta-1